jgi:hypothetical protein
MQLIGFFHPATVGDLQDLGDRGFEFIQERLIQGWTSD